MNERITVQFLWQVDLSYLSEAASQSRYDDALGMLVGNPQCHLTDLPSGLADDLEAGKVIAFGITSARYYFALAKPVSISL